MRVSSCNLWCCSHPDFFLNNRDYWPARRTKCALAGGDSYCESINKIPAYAGMTIYQTTFKKGK